MVVLERFLLTELKDIIRYVKTKHDILHFHKIYLLNKYDIITILRNSGFFIEDNPHHLLFRYDDDEIKFYATKNKRCFKGKKIKNFSFTREHKEVILKFN